MATLSRWTVKQVSELTGVSIRTLHYYDEIGLLSPRRSGAGYRIYTDTELLRLQQILIGRTLGFALEAIRRSLDDPKFDVVAALRRQRELLAARVAESHRMIASIDATLDRLTRKEAPVTDHDMFARFESTRYEAETQLRWGTTDTYQESRRRTSRYDANQWTAIRAEGDAIFAAAAAAMRSGTRVDSPEAATVVERHRRHIDRWYYPLTTTRHASLADMWEADARFRANIDRFEAGLTEWFANAVRLSAPA